MNTIDLDVGNIEAINFVEKTMYKVREVKLKDKAIFEAVKRIFDICASLIAIIILSVPLLVIGLLIKLDSPGSIIYKQERLGKNGKPFTLYKFRTMRTDAEKDGPKWACVDDDRCTKIGSILRNYRFDEFPQLFNILKGDMSIVGPRPERAFFYNEFEKYINGFDQRLLVTPGLTGLAQVNGGYDLKPEEKILYDIEYIEKRNFLLDLKIIFKTVKIVFYHLGSR